MWIMTTAEHERRIAQLERFYVEKLEDLKASSQAMLDTVKLNHQAEVARHQAELNRLSLYATKPPVIEEGPTALDQFPLTPEQQEKVLGSNDVAATISKWCDLSSGDDEGMGVALKWIHNETL